MVRLFINNVEVELTNDVQFAITKQFEDLTNPTDIINDWSKTVSIPFTQKNNELFGHIYNPDKVIVDGGTIGIYFNPLKKLDFRLEWNGAVLMTGYAKMNEVKQISGNGTYEITLFGELGRVFGEMQKITFDTASDMANYIIDGSSYVNSEINRNLVYQSWTSSGQTTDLLKQTGDIGYSITDIIGFAPNNSFSDGFDYKTYQTDASHTYKFEETLGTGFTQDTGVEPSTAIPEGLLPREIGEYRSYYQLPFIYWNKLFKIFQAKAESITGYSFELDANWFSTSNPYWYNLVYMLKPFDIKNGERIDNSYQYLFDNASGSSAMFNWTSSTGNFTTTHSSNSGVYQTNYENIEIYDAITRKFNIPENSDEIEFGFNLNFTLRNFYMSSRIKTDNGLKLRIKANGANGHTETVNYFICDENCTIAPSGYSIIKVGETTGTTHDIAFTVGAYFDLNRTNFGESVYFTADYEWYKNSFPFDYETLYSCLLYRSVSPLSVFVQTGVFRSNGDFTLNDLWNNDYNLFGEILKYCKIFRIGIFADDIKKQVKFIPLSTYFSNYTVTDWTDKVDKSRDFIIKPVTFENKYVLFNYEDSDTKLGKQYKEKYGVNYGDYRLITEYNFNSDTTELFENVQGSIVNTDNVLSWENLYTYHKITYSFPAEIFVYCKNDENKFVDTFGRFYFHNGLANFSTEAALHMRPVRISDDTPLQGATDTYFYSQMISYLKAVTTYPKLDVLNGDNLCIFNAPKENYTYLNNYSGKASIYNNLWENYINERYNVQNKQITCYMQIKPADYIYFDYNHLIKVNNQLCIVNKIYDYDVTSNSTTKVDLITIQDITGYTSNNYTS